MVGFSTTARWASVRIGQVAAPVSLALMLTACGSSSSSDSASDLFHEYLTSTNIEGDQDRGRTSADRLAEFAAEGSPSQVESALLAAYPCGTNAKEAEAACELDVSVNREAGGFAGSAGKVYVRKVLAKRANGRLEFVYLYVARRHDGTAELVDSEGKGYRGGLDDFRQHNGLLSSDDQILTPRELTATPGKGEIVAVSGHTGTAWTTWLITGAGVVVLLGVGAALFRIRSRRRTRGDTDPGGY